MASNNGPNNTPMVAPVDFRVPGPGPEGRRTNPPPRLYGSMRGGVTRHGGGRVALSRPPSAASELSSAPATQTSAGGTEQEIPSGMLSVNTTSDPTNSLEYQVKSGIATTAPDMPKSFTSLYTQAMITPSGSGTPVTPTFPNTLDSFRVLPDVPMKNISNVANMPSNHTNVPSNLDSMTHSFSQVNFRAPLHDLPTLLNNFESEYSQNVNVQQNAVLEMIAKLQSENEQLRGSLGASQDSLRELLGQMQSMQWRVSAAENALKMAMMEKDLAKQRELEAKSQLKITMDRMNFINKDNLALENQLKEAVLKQGQAQLEVRNKENDLALLKDKVWELMGHQSIEELRRAGFGSLSEVLTVLYQFSRPVN